jgi:uracil phosphoribosyltransferase
MGSISYGGFNKSSVLVVVEATEASNDDDEDVVVAEEPAAATGASMNDATGTAKKHEHSINVQKVEVNILVV